MGEPAITLTNARFNTADESAQWNGKTNGYHFEAPPERPASGGTATLSFHNLSYWVEVGKPWKKRDKMILRDVSGVLEPGLSAIMGPTGSGKTSLLDLLAQRKSPGKGLSGSILLNGSPLPNDFKVMSGYVVQDDVMLGTMTVRENFMFTADLRLPPPRSPEDKRRVVDELLEELGLVECQHTKIGTELIKGVSGGERKRCNIGMELITKPKILFLDEPTTGLDASTSLMVISILSNLAASGGRTIVFSIHQPRFSIYKLFDCLHLLSSYGQTIYHGPANNAVNYFQQYGLVCETFNNPPDFFLDIILQHSTKLHIEDTEDMRDDMHKSRSIKNFDEVIPEDQRKDLATYFKDSDENQHLQQKCLKIMQRNDTQNALNQEDSFTEVWLMQFLLLCRRSIKNYIRNPEESLAPILQSVIVATITGFVFFDIKKDETGFQNMYGGMFFVVVQMVFANISAIDVFIAGRALFLHELANQYYVPSSFYCAKLLTDILPLRAFPTIVFSTICYWLYGLANDAGKFFFFNLVSLSVGLSACGMTFFFSIMSGIPSVAAGLLTVSGVFFIIFAGLIVNKSTIPVWLRWVRYISIPGWGLAANAASQIKDIEFCEKSRDSNGTVVLECDSGQELLDRQDIAYDTADQWIAVSVNFALAIFFFGVTYIRILTLRKNK